MSVFMIRGELGMKLRLQPYKKIIPAILIVISFLLIMNYYQSREIAITVDPDKFNVVKSKKELDKEFARYIPGLKLAKEINLVKPLQIEFPVIKENREFKIEEAWYYMDRLYMMYSISLKQTDDDPNIIPTISVDEISLETINGDSLTSTINKNKKGPHIYQEFAKGFVYGNRIYKGIVLKVDDEVVDKLLISEAELNNIILKNPILFIENKKHEVDQFDDITIDLKYKFENGESLKQVSINQETMLENGDILHWETLQIGVQSSKLTFTIEPSNSPIREINYKIDFPQNDKYMKDFIEFNSHSNWIDYYDEKPTMHLPPFKEIPEFITLDVTSAEYIGEEIIQFSIPREEIISGELQVEKKIGKTKDYLFTYAGMTTENMNINVKFGVASTYGERSPFNVHFMENDQYELILNTVDREIHGPIVKITNEMGQEVPYVGIFGMAERLINYQTIVLEDEPVVRDAKQLDVTIFNIPYLVESKNTEKIKIKLK
jgi:hypothetical protein